MNDTDLAVQSGLPLLKEYTTKLQQIDGGPDADDPWYFTSLQPAARKLAQFVSQRINGVNNDALRLELELRLAEFEAALRQASLPRKRRGP